MHLSFAERIPLFILTSSVCWFLQCLISTLTDGGKGGHLFRLTYSVVLWGWRSTANKYPWRVLTVSWPHWVCPRSQCVCFPSLHCSGSSLLCLQLSEVGPGLRVLPRSKRFRFRFRFSGTPQRRRLSQTCILCPSEVRAAQATRYLTSTVSRRCRVSYQLSNPSCSDSWVAAGMPISGGPCLSVGELISGCDPPSGCQPPRIPRSIG